MTGEELETIQIVLSVDCSTTIQTVGIDMLTRHMIITNVHTFTDTGQVEWHIRHDDEHIEKAFMINNVGTYFLDDLSTRVSGIANITNHDKHDFKPLEITDEIFQLDFSCKSGTPVLFMTISGTLLPGFEQDQVTMEVIREHIEMKTQLGDHEDLLVAGDPYFQTRREGLKQLGVERNE